MSTTTLCSTLPWSWSLALALLATACGPSPASSSAEPLVRGGSPNILLIVADDLGWGDLGCYGASDASTPRLDALAAQGVRCTSFYVPSPVCSPSRASLLSGQVPERHGLSRALIETDEGEGLEARVPLLPAWLSDCGYATGLVGKWHLGDRPEQLPTRRGFDEFFGMLHASSDYWHHTYRGEPDLWDGTQPAAADGEYATDLYTRKAIDFIGEHAGTPWFLMLAYNAPHLAEDRESLPAPEAFREPFAGLDAPPQRRDFLAAVAALDDGVGRVLDALARLGLERDTLVIFLSDNGPVAPWGSTGPLRGRKDTLDEGGLRVPCLLRWPGRLPAGTECDAPLLATDLPATILVDACPAPPPGATPDGVDVLPVLAGRAGPPHPTLCWTHESRRTDRTGRTAFMSALRKGRWRLTFTSAGTHELHDLLADPGQTRDLAPERPEVLAELRADLDAELRRLTALRR